MTTTESRRPWHASDSLKNLLAGLTVLVLVVGWATTWTKLSGQVSNNTVAVAELKREKVSVELYRADLRRLEEKIDTLQKSLDHLSRKNNILLTEPLVGPIGSGGQAKKPGARSWSAPIRP